MESWPPTEREFEIGPARVRENLDRVRALMREHELEALLVTSADRYLNEYTPRVDNHRYYLSGFTGSTALMVVPAEGRAKLYVDGRYFIQADLEVDHDVIDVVKVRFGTMIQQAALDDLSDRAVGYEGDRVPQGLVKRLDEVASRAMAFDAGEVAKALLRQSLPHAKPIELIEPSISGRSVMDKLAAVFSQVDRPEETVLLLGALDDIAWLSDGRGYHFAYQSSFAAVGFAVCDGVHIAVDPAVYASVANDDRKGVHWYTDDPAEILASATFDAMGVIRYDASQTNAAFVRRVAQRRPSWKLIAEASPVVAAKAVKTPEELAHFEAINVRSSRAIAKTIRWVRARMARGEPVTELAYYEAANGFYADEGARDLSFHTIAAVGPNSAIIHFSDPRPEIEAAANDFMLLDSGGLYEGGFCTDITRTFIAGGRRAAPTTEQRKIYTLVLKGVLRGMMAIFPEGTRGSFLDAVVRAPLYAAGHDYAHGTGHGVGIHVHEPGVGLAPTSTLGLKAGHVSSIEPGIYIEGFGGVRIENVVTYEPHPEYEGFLRSRPLNFTGLDEHLVDRDLLDDAEREAFDAYQAECARRGTADLDAD